MTIPAWSCMLTGCTPTELGLYGFRHRKLGAYEDRYLADSRHVRRPRLWDILGKAGFTAGLLGIPQTWPVFPLQGYVIGDAPVAGPGLTYPDELRHEVQRVVGEYQPDVLGLRSAAPDQVLADICAITDQRFALFHHLLRCHPCDFHMMVDLGPDRIHHRFFRYCDPTHRLHPQNSVVDPVRDYYRRLDSHLAATLAQLPSSTHLLIVSDHGARSLEGGFCLNDWLIAQGLLSLRVPATTPRPFDESLVDWSRTSAWAWGGYHGRVFVNLCGREPQGLVPAAEYGSFLDRLSEALQRVEGPNGGLLGNRVLRLGESACSPQGDYPDLMVYCGNLAYRAIGSVGHEPWFLEGNDTGPDDANHDPEGVWLYKGPGLCRPGEQKDSSLLAIAPLVLSWFGLHAA